MLTKNLALISQSRSVSADDLNEVAAALQKQVSRDVAPIWGTKATINVFKHLKSVPTGYWPVVIKDNIHQAGAGGYHSKRHNQPFALIQAGNDWVLSTGHEVLEMLIDPWGNQTVAADSLKPGQGRVMYLLEACDPCEAGQFAYTINGITVSDFITPNYHDPVASASVRYSFTGSIKKPREVLPGGYLSWFDPESQQIWQAINRGNGLEFRDLGTSPGGFSLRHYVDSQMRLKPVFPDGYSASLAESKLLGNTSAATREKSSSAAADIWEEDINSLTRNI
ncbi:hypothetical protein [Mucilaginibacter sp. L3T2-6]|uniref:hypothetical protein n=1 Tax=Mucilaginibacter sp. L3T2-6 TaxID=3062491 RepID=UPI002676E615|nr:hypothetical protein [Mucilaginibacter sp. L3T2-6]MDO3644150.1 hypothetical protein [Mucilaginibacter sp. L3T2-6]MDV6216569.1 hypothetical protein [Mucilaginibacter sp. L3T2-6]